MKPFLLVLFLLIPLVYSQENVLEARKASLDLNANEFIFQMNAAIGFSSNKSTDVQDLTAIKNSFESKLEESFNTATLDILKLKEKEMKDLSRQFKDLTKENFKENTGELKIALFKAKQNNKDRLKDNRLKDKKDALNQERRKLVNVAYDKRILEITARIEADKSEGKESKIQKVLLEKFQKSKLKLNETEFIDSGLQIESIRELGSKAMFFFRNIFSSLENKTKTTGEKI